MKTTIGPKLLALLLAGAAHAQTSDLPEKGWAQTSVNTVVFRGNSVVTAGSTQYVAYYNGDKKVVAAKRTLGTTTWQSLVTQYTGTVTDAHNSISIMVDDDGYLHVAWDMHAGRLRYCKSTAAGALTLGSETAMIGSLETETTYPQFLKLPDGDMLFLYRSGGSGNGNLVINKYSLKAKKWTRLFDKLIDGESARNAYWEAHLDANGVIHLGWVWRETSDVATNHDICYARSNDGGSTWEKSTGAKYTIPITATTAEYALKIPQNSDLINQTSIYGDEKSRPYIASYWTQAGIPQYQLVYNDGAGWKTSVVSNRKLDFSLSGVGTQKIPISRPQLMVDGRSDSVAVYMVYRDTEQVSKVSLAQTLNLAKGKWSQSNLTSYSVDAWEPSFDTELWNRSHVLNLFVQRAGQASGEGAVNLAPQPVTILEWKPILTSSVRPLRILGATGSSRASFDLSGRRQNLTQVRCGSAPGVAVDESGLKHLDGVR